jgi:hypothetical protein
MLFELSKKNRNALKVDYERVSKWVLNLFKIYTIPPYSVPLNAYELVARR